ncbi:hypothetical protein DdX_13208 [Ditylenchus destructor]|uniref:Uncharacterized protein n=1 Tax=Ditylenchus destructor TaxID=166010 RepID=A0AAD4MUC5_9BILA|nr:hypothetical protein DdX_13208 [Ditylenchus destructor]
MNPKLNLVLLAVTIYYSRDLLVSAPGPVDPAVTVKDPAKDAAASKDAAKPKDPGLKIPASLNAWQRLLAPTESKYFPIMFLRYRIQESWSYICYAFGQNETEDFEDVKLETGWFATLRNTLTKNNIAYNGYDDLIKKMKKVMDDMTKLSFKMKEAYPDNAAESKRSIKQYDGFKRDSKGKIVVKFLSGQA